MRYDEAQQLAQALAKRDGKVWVLLKYEERVVYVDKARLTAVECHTCFAGFLNVKDSLTHIHFQDDERDQTQKLTATDKRFCAIGAISKTALNEDGTRDWDRPNGMIADLIMELVDLGRTDRWKATVRRWAAMVREDGAESTWGLLQGMVYAVHAAD